MQNTTSVETKAKEESRAAFLSCLGDKGKQDLESDTLGENDRRDTKEIYKRLKDLIQSN